MELYVDINEARWGVGVEYGRHDGNVQTLLELIQERNAAQGREQASRTDVRFGTGPDERFFLLNKHDGTIREVVPEGGPSDGVRSWARSGPVPGERVS